MYEESADLLCFLFQPFIHLSVREEQLYSTSEREGGGGEGGEGD